MPAPAAESPLAFLAPALAELEARGLRRRVFSLSGAQGPVVEIAGKRLVNFSSNDYLGLAAHRRVVEAARAALDRFGAGTGASRLVAGQQEEHEALEAELAALKGSEAALLFNSGYHANLGAIPALVGEGDLVVSDALNHASLIDGIRLSRARVQVVPHRDVAAFAQALAPAARRKLVVTDSLFSMDGTVAPLCELRALCDRHGAALYVDEAHATGVFGPTGAGLCEALGVVADVQMGTLGKALGSFGAFVAGSALLREWLLQRSRAFVFTTALPAHVCAAARAALAVVREEPQRRAHLLALSQRLRARLGLPGVEHATPVIPLVVGEPARAVALSERLEARGFLVRAIRPPTVPPGTSRLRFALSAAHTEAQVDAVAAATLEALEQGTP